jgi:nucleoside phosphorylase
MWWDPPLYLHFFDRELGRAVGFNLTSDLAESILKRLLLGTTSRFYFGLSPAWESPAMAGDMLDLYSLLERAEAIDLVSNYVTIDEFLESRLPLYRHDALRYPMYFDRLVQARSRIIIPTQVKSTSATAELSRDLSAWANGDDAVVSRPILRLVLKELAQRETQAITFAYFGPGLAAMNAPIIARQAIRRRISLGYTRHYKDFASAELSTGIRGLELFESLARQFPLFDIVLLELLLRFAGFGAYLDSSWRAHERFWIALPGLRSDTVHVRTRSEITLILEALARCARIAAAPVPLDFYGLRGAIAARLHSASAKIGQPRKRYLPTPERSFARIRQLGDVLQRDKDFAEQAEEVLVTRSEHSCDVLLMVATDIERDTVLALAKKRTRHGYAQRFGKRRTYYELGDIGGARLVMVQCEIGSSAPGASQATASDAVDELKPDSVVLVGIAFGVDPDKQEIGEIVVSRQLKPYELQRVGTDEHGGLKIVSRGDRVSASSRLVGRLRAARPEWTGAAVKFELVITGEKLVDNIDFRRQLEAFEPEAAGGEMEGAGLYAACAERNTNWVIVKAICDWADGKKREQKAERQRLAANEAIGFVLHAISQGGFTRVSR